MINIALALYVSKTMMVASFEHKAVTPANLFPYTVATQDYSHPEGINNPAFLPLLNQKYIIASKERVYEEGEISSNYLVAGTNWRNISTSISWNRFGIDEYIEDTVTFSIGYKFKYLSIGSSINYNNLSIKADDINFSTNQSDFSSSILIMPVQCLNFSFIQHNIYSYIEKEREDLLYPEWSSGISLRVKRGLWFYWNLTDSPFQKVNSFSTSIHLLKSLSLRLGYTKESNSYATAILLNYKNLTTSYGFKYHPYLGNTHSVAVTISNIENSFTPMNYNRNLKTRKEKININKSNYEDLIKRTSLKPLHAKRLIKYKTIFGPISKKTLGQVGLTSKEKKIILREVYGLHIPIKKKFVRYKKYKKKRKNIKQFFVNLLKTGIDPSLSLELSDIAKKRNRRFVINNIKKNNSISPELKMKLTKLCTKYL